MDCLRIFNLVYIVCVGLMLVGRFRYGMLFPPLFNRSAFDILVDIHGLVGVAILGLDFLVSIYSFGIFALFFQNLTCL